MLEQKQEAPSKQEALWRHPKHHKVFEISCLRKHRGHPGGRRHLGDTQGTTRLFELKCLMLEHQTSNTKHETSNMKHET